MNQVVLVAWVCLSLVVVLVVLVVRHRSNKPLNLELSQIISLILAVLGVVSSCDLLYKAFTLQQLKDLLGPDIVTLIIGGIAVIWVSAKEVWKLF